jgi:hypothetical protein
LPNNNNGKKNHHRNNNNNDNNKPIGDPALVNDMLMRLINDPKTSGRDKIQAMYDLLALSGIDVGGGMQRNWMKMKRSL